MLIFRIIHVLMRNVTFATTTEWFEAKQLYPNGENFKKKISMNHQL